MLTKTVQDSVDHISHEAILDRLASAKGATFDALADVPEIDSRCLEGTRLELLQRLRSWAEDTESKPVFWLNGAAGSGKSTLARTIAEELHNSHRLGASFFYKHGEGDRGSASKFFPTIARQLAKFVPSLTLSIKQAIISDPDIAEKALSEQFKKLIVEPFSEAGSSEHEQPKPIVIVVDALDECDKEDDMKLLIKLFSQPIAGGALRILLTSRPELPIRLGFKMLSAGTYDNVILHEIPVDIVKHDLSLYLQHGFDAMRSEHDDLPREWPGIDNLKALVELAYPLFIIAATICRFVADPLWPPQQQLEYLLTHKQVTSDGLNETYAPILTRLLRTTGVHKVNIIDDFKAIVGPIVTVAEPLSIKTFGSLLDMAESRIINRLKTLHSVLSIPTDKTSSAPIRILHLSFANFLLDPDRKHSHDFWIEEKTMHSRMAHKCLGVLCAPDTLRQDICNLSYPGYFRKNMEPSHIQKNLPKHVQYACQYWVYHVKRSETHASGLVPLVHTFLDEHFLHWCEVMSILGQTSELLRLVDILSGVFNQESTLVAFIYDARRFLSNYSCIINIAPLQIYTSCAVFAPRLSLVKNHVPTWLETLPETPTNWSPVLRTLEGHSRSVEVSAWSPNGGLLASGSYDKTVILWDVESGQLLQQIEADIGTICSIAFSFAGDDIAVSGLTGTIQVWDVTTGLLIHTCQVAEDSCNSPLSNPGDDVESSDSSEEKSSIITKVTFTPNDEFFVSATNNGLVRVWSMDSGNLVSCFSDNLYEDFKYSLVEFSKDGQKVAIASPASVAVWNILSGQLECNVPVSQIPWDLALDHSSRILAIAERDDHIRLWDVASGQLKLSLPGKHEGMTFSPSGNELACILNSHGAIAIWNLAARQQNAVQETYTEATNSISYSPDGTIIACCSTGSIIKLFESQLGKVSLEDLHETDLITVNICASGGQLLVTGHQSGSIKTWSILSGRTSLLQVVQPVKSHQGWIWDLAITHDSKLIASCSYYIVNIWSQSEGQLQLLHVLEHDIIGPSGYPPDTAKVIFSKAEDLVASLTDERTFKIWQTGSGRLVHSGTLNKHTRFREYLQRSCIDIDGCAIAGKELFPDIIEDDKPLYMKGNWIFAKGQRLLWLPPDYRGETVTHGGTVAIGLPTGRIVSFTILLDALDQAGLFKV